MTLPETFESVRPAIVAFISRAVRSQGGQPPGFPSILGTGFFVEPRGVIATNRHVAEIFEKLPRHPTTGAFGAGAAVFLEPRAEAGGTAVGIVFADIERWWILDNFKVTGDWSGESVPDLAFVQLRATETPALRLDEEPGTLRVGRSIGTAGFPMGTTPILLHGKITQLSPMLRRGIISSVFPFASPFPHGFTIDAMVQPGASGSPIFLEDQPVVVGMVESVLRDHATASITSTETGLSGTVSVPLSTNISVALPGGLIADALRDLCQGGQLKTEGLPTLQSLVPEDHERYRQMTWETFTVPRGE